MKKLAIFLTLCLLCAMVAGCSDDTRKYQEMLSRAQESFDHHMSVQQGGFSIPSDFSLPEGSVIIPSTDEFNRIEEIGTPGMDYPVEVMEMLLPATGVPSPDGWYIIKGGKLHLYSRDGEKLWENEGGLILDAGAFGVVGKTVNELWAYDKNGNLLWKDAGDYDRISACITHDGQVYAAVQTDACLSFRKYAPDGSVVSQKDLTVSQEVDIYAMKYAEGHGLAVSMSGRWMENKQSDFAILLLDENFSTLWTSWQELPFHQNLTVADGALYAGSFDETVCISLADGKVTAQAEGKLAGVGEKVYLHAKKNILTVCNKELHPLGELSIAGEPATPVEETEDGGVLVITRHILGILPSPPEVSSIQYAIEYIFTRYDKDGKILYRVGYDDSRM